MIQGDYTDRLDEIEEMATKLAVNEDPLVRCYGRLLMSDVAGRFDDFFRKECEAGTPLIDVLSAVTKFSAEMAGSVILSTHVSARKDMKNAAAKIFDAYLDNGLKR